MEKKVFKQYFRGLKVIVRPESTRAVFVCAWRMSLMECGSKRPRVGLSEYFLSAFLLLIELFSLDESFCVSLSSFLGGLSEKNNNGCDATTGMFVGG
jgi:hypothetical protein